MAGADRADRATAQVAAVAVARRRWRQLVNRCRLSTCPSTRRLSIHLYILSTADHCRSEIVRRIDLFAPGCTLEQRQMLTTWRTYSRQTDLLMTNGCHPTECRSEPSPPPRLTWRHMVTTLWSETQSMREAPVAVAAPGSRLLRFLDVRGCLLPG